MSGWTSEELNQIGKAEELLIASLRNDGTLRKTVTIWVVRLGDDLYVRSVNGRASAWFRGVQTQHAGRIRAGGVEKDVAFVEDARSGFDDQIDAAYRTKYYRYAASILDHITSPEARSATIKLVPRPAGYVADLPAQPTPACRLAPPKYSIAQPSRLPRTPSAYSQ
jgi:hypothetical protein